MDAPPPPLAGTFRPPGTVDFGDHAVLAAWQAACTVLCDRRQPDGLAALLPGASSLAPQSPQTLPLLRRARKALPALMSATRTVDLAPALTAALPLVGAGPGLTPSWDDLLMGYLCGLQACTPRAGGERARFLQCFGRALAVAGADTTPASRDWIRRTVERNGPPWLLAVLASIGAGDPTCTACRAAQALRVGHTSGADGLLGALLGSAAWQPGHDADDLVDLLLQSSQPTEYA